MCASMWANCRLNAILLRSGQHNGRDISIKALGVASSFLLRISLALSFSVSIIFSLPTLFLLAGGKGFKNCIEPNTALSPDLVFWLDLKTENASGSAAQAGYPSAAPGSRPVALSFSPLSFSV